MPALAASHSTAAGEVDLLLLHDEVDDVALGLAAEAVVHVLVGVDRERRASSRCGTGTGPVQRRPTRRSGVYWLTMATMSDAARTAATSSSWMPIGARLPAGALRPSLSTRSSRRPFISADTWALTSSLAALTCLDIGLGRLEVGLGSSTGPRAWALISSRMRASSSRGGVAPRGGPRSARASRRRRVRGRCAADAPVLAGALGGPPADGQRGRRAGRAASRRARPGPSAILVSSVASVACSLGVRASNPARGP